jgi:hypothetical protein
MSDMLQDVVHEEGAHGRGKGNQFPASGVTWPHAWPHEPHVVKFESPANSIY